MNVFHTKRFQKDYQKITKDLQEKIDEKLAIFITNSHHPSLRIKKLEGRENIWEGRISKNYRFTFSILGDTFILRRIGSHKILKNP